LRILALETEKPGLSSKDFKPFLKEEAKKVWEFYQEDFIREIYFRADQDSAILILECEYIEIAKKKLSQLPMVSEGLIDFELIALSPYPGFSRLFKDEK
jgi:hypothetical protein